MDRRVSIEQSATVRMADLVRNYRADGIDTINLATGTPDFKTPDHVVAAGKRALDDGRTKGTMTAGLPELRDAISQKFTEENGIETDPDRIGVTPGSKFALFAAITTLVGRTDEVVVLDPSWGSYKAMVKLAGGTVNRIVRDSQNGFALQPGDLAETVSESTRVLIVNNPSNPDGTVFSREVLGEIRDFAVDHDFWVISDEIYEKLTYDAQHVSIGALDGMAERTVTTNGFSKGYAMLGWRLGYFTGPSEVVATMQTIQTQTVSSATSFAQHGAVAALEGTQEPTREMRRIYNSRIETLMNILDGAGITVTRPEGALYVFLPVDAEDDVELAETLLEEERVAVAPGSAFGIPGYIRVSCTVPEERIKTAMERILGHIT